MQYVIIENLKRSVSKHLKSGIRFFWWGYWVHGDEMEAYPGIDPSLFFKMVGTYAYGRGTCAHPSSSALPPPIFPCCTFPCKL